MNLEKYTFGVSSGKFLGFIVRHRGIKIDPSKIDVILKMLEPRNTYKLKGLQESWLIYKDSFITY